MRLTYTTGCSGIEAPSLAWEPLGWSPLWFCEIERQQRQLLKHYWPDVHCHTDMLDLAALIDFGELPPSDVWAAGTPCQAYSKSGLREGLDDPRGALTLSYVEVLDAHDKARAQRGQPATIGIWENVLGVLSDKTNAFGWFLSKLAKEPCAFKAPSPEGWPKSGIVFAQDRTIAWRSLDAKYFGVAQRRPRVFVVISGRNDLNPAQVLFEPEGSDGVHTPGITYPEVSYTAGIETRAFNMLSFGRYKPAKQAYTLKARDHKAGSSDIILTNGRPRHLMPVERERLMGMPDGYTDIMIDGKPASERFRYEATGNSQAVPCMAWLGKRIEYCLMHGWGNEL